MFHRPAVAAELSRFVPVELFTDRKGDPEEEKYRQFRDKTFKTAANPFYVILELP